MLSSKFKTKLLILNYACQDKAGYMWDRAKTWWSSRRALRDLIAKSRVGIYGPRPFGSRARVVELSRKATGARVRKESTARQRPLSSVFDKVKSLTREGEKPCSRDQNQARNPAHQVPDGARARPTTSATRVWGQEVRRSDLQDMRGEAFMVPGYSSSRSSSSSSSSSSIQ